MTLLLVWAEMRGDKSGHPVLSQLQLMGTATMQAVGDVMDKDHLSLLPHHYHPFLPLVMWFSDTRVAKEDGAQTNRNKNVCELTFFEPPPLHRILREGTWW